MTHQENEEDFIRLMSSCQKRLFLYLRGLLFSRDLAEETLQDTNVILWRKRAEYEPGTNFVAWACQIAFFEACRARRDQRRNLPVFSDVFLADFAPDLLAAAEASDSLEKQLEDCIKELKLRDREILERRYAAGSNTKTVAESMGCSIDAIYRALRRIHETLFNCITSKRQKEDQG
jgi:RNA polymerase sigma-70 factor (ECF subfamily)